MKTLFILISLFFAVSLSARQRDSRVREYLPPARIVWQQESQLIQGANHLLLSGNGQSNLVNHNICKLSSTDRQHPAILLDFGKELQGGLQIVTGMPASHEPVAVRIRLGESVSEAMCDIDGVNGASNDHAMRDFTIRLPWLGVMEVGNSGFRFARIDLLDDSVELHIKEIRAISVFRDIPYKGSFRCNDERLNRIWQTGAYTVHLNMQEYIWDGIKRDRLVWIGDLHPEVMTVNTVFGYNEVIPKSLDFIRDATPLPGWMNGMCSYSLWWIIIQKDLYMYQGNLDYLKSQRDYLLRLVKQIDERIDENGVERLDGIRFLDWPTSENRNVIHSGLQSLSFMAMKAAVQIGEYIGDRDMIRMASSCLERMKGVAVDAHDNSQAAALNIISGLSTDPEKDCETILKNGLDGFSTFYGYYMLEALAMLGKYDEALDFISTYWGAMLDLGATTFWEDLKYADVANAARIDEIVPPGKHDIHAGGGAYCYKGLRLSLCHGWASGPTSWLTRHVLGIVPIEPGCRVLQVKPNLGPLQSVKGTFPTPYGIVTVSCTKNGRGKVVCDIQAPKGVKIVR